MTELNPYLGFRDTARQAIEFYHGVFGGELSISTFGEMHASDDPAEADKVMHSQLRSPNGLVLMASDTPNSMEASSGSSISISLSGDDEAELRGYWDRLLVGGTETVPFERAPWGDIFGMLTDAHGVAWLVNVVAQKSE